MNIEQLTDLFKWMSIINIGLLVFSGIAVMVLKSLVVKIHTAMFDLTESQVAENVYAYLGRFKVLIIVFNITPYFALLLRN